MPPDRSSLLSKLQESRDELRRCIEVLDQAIAACEAERKQASEVLFEVEQAIAASRGE